MPDNLTRVAFSASDQDRLLAKVVAGDNGCWVFTGTRTRDGYGQLGMGGRVNQRTMKAHRVSYEMNVGPIPVGLEIDHLCRTRACVRPDHMEPVTHRENILRGESPAALHAIKTHCPNGHPYDDENTYIATTGQRCCRACHRYPYRRDKRPRVSGKCPVCEYRFRLHVDGTVGTHLLGVEPCEGSGQFPPNESAGESDKFVGGKR